MNTLRTSATSSRAAADLPPVAFIGGGNMASAIIGGLAAQGMPLERIHVVEPFDAARAQLQSKLGVTAKAAAGEDLRACHTVVWAVKPQSFREAAQTVAPFTGSALHLSVAAGIRSDSISGWLGTQRVVRGMPNTPALVGAGMTGLYAGAGVSEADRSHVDVLLSSTGQRLWFDQERQLDAVTALSGSGPAYVFYFLEAMVQGGVEMGLTPDQARQLAVATFAGATALAAASDDPLQEMRQRVTSKGGTTYAAITSLEADGVQQAFVKAVHAAQQRAKELGDEFGT
ncbi:pyrroline-5-carboxylate reductase [uncultured Ramlibacter sp.]|uniref:pyrroline-5-carboxylate reductase n=1 Tax=uncultured Ramlibacter sp. TaxID=260755 RepID=UPI0026187501|nr:pyrroline-5-carboxylate reductase [uncultured Ramlibacter sp.]